MKNSYKNKDFLPELIKTKPKLIKIRMLQTERLRNQ